MAAKPANEGAEAAKPKSKKLLIIVVALVLVLVGGGAAAYFLFLKPHPEEDGAEETVKEAPKAKAHKKPETPSEFLPLEALVVNLADPGGSRFAQVGITLQVMDAKTGDVVKKLMPVIRNDILRSLSKRSSEELLVTEGKDKLAEEILDMIREHADMPANKKGYSPVEAVLFSSFIVQ
jgi:flagellar FliL protein